MWRWIEDPYYSSIINNMLYTNNNTIKTEKIKSFKIKFKKEKILNQDELNRVC